MKIVVAYSGGLDTSVLLLWLKEKYNAEIIAYCADVGQGEELDGLEEKALSTGASKCYIGDLKEEFAADYIYPMFQANALYEGRYLLGTSIARPCISKGMVDVAIKEGADAIAHGATGKGNDQVRFELSVAALAPDIKMIAPWRDADHTPWTVTYCIFLLKQERLRTLGTMPRVKRIVICMCSLSLLRKLQILPSMSSFCLRRVTL
jgi:argininosuccinate synthase